MDMHSPRKIAVAGAVVLLLAPAAFALDVSLFGSYWDTDAAGDTAGGGLTLGLPINERLAVELRASYFEELSDDPLENAFDSDDPVFQEKGVNAIPIDGGLRWTFPSSSAFRPYIAGGGSYFVLDSDFGEIEDELGYYAALGTTIGDGEGADFMIEAIWRKLTAQVELDPDDLDDVDDLDVDDHADLDLDGLGVNAGVRWRF
jgi:hypothetical protein